MVSNGHSELTPTRVGATGAPLDISPAGAETVLPLEREAARALVAALAERGGLGQGVYLRLEEITGKYPANLIVYLDLPGREAQGSPDAHRAGTIGLFGLAQASKPDQSGEGGRGMTFSLDVSDLMARLCREADSIPASLRVRLVFTRPPRSEAHIRIGMISLLHASQT